MSIDYAKMIVWFSQIIWPTLRIGALVAALPFISAAGVPPRVRLILTLSLALITAPFINSALSFEHFQGTYIIFIFQELLLGLLMGFIFQLVFQVFIISGQIIAMQMGLGFATMVDPASHSSVPLISQFFLMMVTLVFLALNGHLAVFAALIESFKKMPVGQVMLDGDSIWRIVEFSAWTIKESVLVAIPAILSLLAVSLSFAIITKVAPQMNIFSIGFPLTLLLGIIILQWSIPGFVEQIEDSIDTGLLVLTRMVN